MKSSAHTAAILAGVALVGAAVVLVVLSAVDPLGQGLVGSATPLVAAALGVGGAVLASGTHGRARIGLAFVLMLSLLLLVFRPRGAMRLLADTWRGAGEAGRSFVAVALLAAASLPLLAKPAVFPEMREPYVPSYARSAADVPPQLRDMIQLARASGQPLPPDIAAIAGSFEPQSALEPYSYTSETHLYWVIPGALLAAVAGLVLFLPGGFRRGA
jgi:hypothetical protein